MINPITSARIVAGMSKVAYSRRVGVSRVFLIRSEDGCYERPTGKLAVATCRILRIDRDTLNERYEDFQHYKRIEEVENRKLEKLGQDIKPLTTQVTRLFPPVDPRSGRSSENDLEISIGDSIVKVQEIYPHKVFKEWRSNYWGSALTFSSKMCVHPASVGLYEDGKMSSMPVQLRDALQSMDLIQPDFSVTTRWFYGIRSKDGT